MKTARCHSCERTKAELPDGALLFTDMGAYHHCSECKAADEAQVEQPSL